MFETHQFCCKIDNLKMLVCYKADQSNTFKIIGEHIDQLEIYTIDDQGKPVKKENPLTETGYRSIYFNRENILQYFTSPEEYFLSNLNEQAKSKKWLEKKEKKRQLDFFA